MNSFILVNATNRNGQSYRYKVSGSPDEVVGVLEAFREAGNFWGVQDPDDPERPVFYVNPEHVVAIYGAEE